MAFSNPGTEGGKRVPGAPGDAHFPGIVSREQALSSSNVQMRARKVQKVVGAASCVCRAGEGGGDRFNLGDLLSQPCTQQPP